MDENDLIDAAELGEEAKKFLESDLGKSLLARAQQETLSALEALGECDATDTKAIVNLQNRAALGRQFPEWIREIIHIGDEALHVWKQQNSEN